MKTLSTEVDELIDDRREERSRRSFPARSPVTESHALLALSLNLTISTPACFCLCRESAWNLMMRSAWHSRATWWSGYHKRHSGATPLISVSSHPPGSVCIATENAKISIDGNVNTPQSIHTQRCAYFSISSQPAHLSPSWASHTSSTANHHQQVARPRGLESSLNGLSACFSTSAHGDSRKGGAQGGSKTSAAHTDFARKNMPVWLHVMKRKR